MNSGIGLKSLFKDLNVTWKGSQEIKLTSLTANSKAVGPGSLFIAKRGVKGDGHRYIPEAVAAGAVAILADTCDPFLKGVTQVISPDVNALEAIIAHRFYNYPASQLSVYGVTGTCGKTTTTFLIKHLLDEVGSPCGLIGSVSWMTKEKILPASHTTPDLITTLKLLHEMVEGGCSSVAMEISSHAIDQKRVEGISPKVAVFTNLSHEHLDYHKSMEEYARVKALLFKHLSRESFALVNGDDVWSSFMVQESCAKVVRYGLNPQFELSASDLNLSAQEMQFNVKWKGETARFKTALIGRFNVYNILAAAGVLLVEGFNLPQIAQALEVFPGVPGRLERVPNRRQLNVLVDYAHKPEALKNVLQTLQEIKTGRIITVFGCGGNRDGEKRPKMAAIAESLSDFTIVTSDNPRQEDPAEIARQIILGFQTRDRYTVELDRRQAIAKALEMANSQDLVLIAGKGHETYQIFGDRTVPFDDRLVVQQF